MKTFQAVESQFRELSRCESATTKTCQTGKFMFPIFPLRKYANQAQKLRKTGKREKDACHLGMFAI
ncbi:hypothetical protein [Massilia sp. BJB1822]|uniref:hypothetical protein n=1 Tax=Massilia sp. BJB1822 TaxID=2744470 RepID=UPI001593CF6C|nr:hypothetical protein [Massilia sp. BJB1822]NVD99291.1 hypothetical protein [Massilia sp. BJB1822]